MRSQGDVIPPRPGPLPGPTLSQVLRRRWYAALVGLLIAVGMVAAAFSLAPVSYRATASILFLPPKADSADNPLLELGSLVNVPTAVARSALDDAAVRELARAGITDGYEVDTDPTTSAPLVIVAGTGDSNAAALRAMRQVAALVPKTLAALQQAQNVPAKALIKTSVLNADDKAAAVTKTRTRVLLVAAVAGLALALLLTIAVDRFLLRRAARTKTAHGAAPEVAAGVLPEPRPNGVRHVGSSPSERPRPAASATNGVHAANGVNATSATKATNGVNHTNGVSTLQPGMPSR